MAKAKENKTNAMRILDRNKIEYTTHSYQNKDGKIDGIAVAHKIGKDEDSVFKTCGGKRRKNGQRLGYAYISGDCGL